ncbi:hypothetical protein [Agromyces bauzanensis]
MSTYSSTQAERQAAADCLGQLIEATEPVGRAMLSTPPSGVLERDPAAGLDSAARMVSLHRAVATDHLSSFTALLAHPTSHGPSFTTLDRSFLETWGRAWWVMDAPSSTHAEYRTRAMTVDELETAASRGITLLSGERIEDAIKRAKLDRDSIKLATAEPVPKPPALVRALLQACGSPFEEAKAVYSHVSGVAHGESIYTESLTERPGLAGLFSGVSLPSDNLAKYCTTLFGVTVIGTARLIGVWGLPTAVGDEFTATAAQVGGSLTGALRTH